MLPHRLLMVDLPREIYTGHVLAESDLLGALRHYWGYGSLRPMQANIVRSLLDGRDTCG